MVAPAVRRDAAAHLVEAYEMSERRACSAIGVDRSSVRYRNRRPDDAALRARRRELASERRRFGYRRLHVLLRYEGLVANRKRTQRLYREEGLTVRKRRGRKGAVRTRAPILTVAAPNPRWSVDFVHDQLGDGRRLRVFNVVDDVTKECLAAVVDMSISAKRVAPEVAGGGRPPRQARPHRQRPRHRVHLERHAAVDKGGRRRLAFHRARRADAKPDPRSVQRKHGR